MAGNPRDWAPPRGSNWWDEEDDKAYDRAVRRQQKERGVPFWRRSRRRPRWVWALPPIAMVGFLTAAFVATGSTDDGEAVSLQTGSSPSAPSPSSTEPPPPEVSATAPPATSIPESISHNTTSPPQADLNGDTQCTLSNLGTVMARGTLTNRSSTTSWYTIHVSFNDAAGVRFAEAPAVHNDVRSGETVRWEAKTFDGPVEDPWTCEIVTIERFASQ